MREMKQIQSDKIACLWCGGLDSTTALYYFANKYPDKLIQPYHILIRMGSGKDARERDAVDKIYETLKDRFRNVLEPIRVKHRIRPSDHRNMELIEFIRDEYREKEVILGTHLDPVMHTYPGDSDWDELQKMTGIIIHDLRREGYPMKVDQFAVGVKLLGVEILKMTFSCQLWFKKSCGRCFSCKDRAKLFEEIGEVE